MRNVMIWQEPEPHQRVRNLVKSAFTPKAMARWRPIAERVTNELCDRIEADGATPSSSSSTTTSCRST